MFLFKHRNVRYLTAVVSITTIGMFLYSQTSFDYFDTGPPCACNRCMIEQEDDPWFTERYKPSVLPLLSKRNSVLPAGTYRWWQSLQYLSKRANYTRVADELFRLFPGKEYYMDSGPERRRTCAVVGDSGNLKGSRYGPLIDSSDFILRMNRGLTKGYEEDVGTRTTHRIIYPESAVDVDNTTHLVLFPFKTLDLQWLISAFTTGTINYTYTAVRPTIAANLDRVVILHPAFMKYVHETWLQKHGRYPSTGFLTLVLAIHICDNVNVFGFGADKKGNWHHYFEKTPQNLYTGTHGGNYEYETIVQLFLKNKIQMFRGW